MLHRFILITLSFLALTSCSAKAEIKAPLTLNTPHITESPQLSTSELVSTNSDSTAEEAKSSKSQQKTDFNPSEKTLNIANLTKEQAGNKGHTKNRKYLATNTENYMMLVPTGNYNELRNPLYELRLFVNGEKVGAYKAESGRADTQDNDRNRSGTEAPLPDGEYRIATKVTPGRVYEAGDRFLAIYPQFRTGRSELGIHYDPSHGKPNGEDGTSGCIGLINKDDLTEVLNFVRAYHPQRLKVEIQQKSGNF